MRIHIPNGGYSIAKAIQVVSTVLLNCSPSISLKRIQETLEFFFISIIFKSINNALNLKYLLEDRHLKSYTKIIEKEKYRRRINWKKN